MTPANMAVITPAENKMPPTKNSSLSGKESSLWAKKLILDRKKWQSGFEPRGWWFVEIGRLPFLHQKGVGQFG